MAQKKLKDIQERINKFKTNSHQRCPKPNPEKQIDAFVIALDLVSSVMLGLIAGFALDKLFNSKPFCVIIFLLIGTFVGFRIIWQKLNNKK
ncbi:MAG: AtpZ/AtpI family protein [Candidatus Tisiphia sp.]|nr:AtpZ/AtpI family protein [Candidatus Tisiphia sp.]